jgi:hypothetical protein
MNKFVLGASQAVKWKRNNRAFNIKTVRSAELAVWQSLLFSPAKLQVPALRKAANILLKAMVWKML